MAHKIDRSRRSSLSVESLENRQLLAGLQISIPNILPTRDVVNAFVEASASVKAAATTAAAKPVAAPVAAQVANIGALVLEIPTTATNGSAPIVVSTQATTAPATNTQPTNPGQLAFGSLSAPGTAAASSSQAAVLQAAASVAAAAKPVAAPVAAQVANIGALVLSIPTTAANGSAPVVVSTPVSTAPVANTQPVIAGALAFGGLSAPGTAAPSSSAPVQTASVAVAAKTAAAPVASLPGAKVVPTATGFAVVFNVLGRQIRIPTLRL